MRFKVAIALAVLAVVLPFGATAHAQFFQVMNVNEMTTSTFGDFFVQALELNAQCGAAGDPRCTPFTASQYPVQSSPGAISDKLVIYMNSNGNDNVPTPFPTGAPDNLFDNPFRSPTGVQDSTFQMSSANEPGEGGVVVSTPEFDGDIVGSWQVRIGDLLEYLTLNSGQISNLVFFFDNNETGNPDQDQLALGQVRITDSTGALVGPCFTLSNGTLTGCDALPDVLDGSGNLNQAFIDAAVPILGDFCVNAVTGVAYNIGTAGNAGDCTQTPGDYFITNNLGANNAEFIIFNPALDAFIRNPANANLFLTVDLRLAQLNDGGEQLWICDACIFQQTRVPVPGSAALLGSGLLALGLAGWTYRRRK